MEMLPVADTPLTRLDWIAAATDRYGSSSLGWRFRCPLCKVETAVSEWRAAEAPEGAVAFSCIGRYRPERPQSAFGASKLEPIGCDYTGGGLFPLNPVPVVAEDGREFRMFDFADRPLLHRSNLPPVVAEPAPHV